MIDRDLPERIKDALDIVEVIGEVVPLEKRGANYFGLSPFRNEKTPSFCVNPARQFYFCFSSNLGGDIFSFVQKYYGWDFPQALEELGRRAGIEVKSVVRSDRKDLQLKICESVCLLFEEQLQSPQGQSARDYLTQRKIPKSSWSEFRLGCHAGGYQEIVQRLKAEGLDLEEAAHLGLVGRTQDGKWVDRFRGRLIFPIADERQRIRGFGGRSMGEAQPKYLNSPASNIFDKKRILYGMHLASEHCRKKDYAILCEGYLDVIALHEYGLKNAVCSMGTALTHEQIRSVKRRTLRVISLYDADMAGLAATERNLENFLKEGISAKVVVTPDSKDPDALLHDETLSETEKKAKLRELFAQAVPALDYLLKAKVLSLSDPIERAKALRSIVEVLDRMPDPMERRMLKQEISKRFELPIELLLGKEEASSLAVQAPVAPRRSQSSQKAGSMVWEREIMKFLVKWGRLHDFNLTDALSYLNFSTKWSKILREVVQKSQSSSQIASLAWLDDQDEETRKEVGQWLIGDDQEYASFDLQQLWSGLLNKLRSSYFQGENHRLQDEIKKAETEGQADRLRDLLKEKQDLVRLMKEDEEFKFQRS